MVRRSHAALSFGITVSASLGFEPAHEQVESELNGAIIRYLSESDREKRRALSDEIENLASGSADRIATALADAKLWAPLPKSGAFNFETASAGAVSAAWQLSDDYDPAVEHPSLLCPAATERPQATIERARAAFGEALGGFVVVAFEPPVAGSFHQSPAASGDFRKLLREVRRRFHTDTDRLYVFGSGEDGDAAWILAMTHPDCFAGAVMINGLPPVPYPSQTYDLLVRNLENVPVLTIWERADGRDPQSRGYRVAAHNRGIVEIARRQNVPVTGVELPPVGGGSGPALKLGEQAAMDILGHSRATRGNVSHWFRYPDQGHAAWLHQTEFRGDVWTAPQLSILVPPGADWNEFITGVLREKLAYIGGSVVGNCFDVVTRRSAGIEVELTPTLIDFSKPVSITCNGLERFNGTVSPSISTMLESAYQTLDLKHLVWARKSLDVRTDSAEPTRPGK